MQKEQKSLYRDPVMQVFVNDHYKFSISKKITDKLGVAKGDFIMVEVVNKQLILKKSPQNVGYKITVNESKSVGMRSKSLMIAMDNYLRFMKIKGDSYLFKVDLETMAIEFLRVRTK